MVRGSKFEVSGFLNFEHGTTNIKPLVVPFSPLPTREIFPTRQSFPGHACPVRIFSQ
jgi:hypothetical protein